MTQVVCWYMSAEDIAGCEAIVTDWIERGIKIISVAVTYGPANVGSLNHKNGVMSYNILAVVDVSELRE